MTGWAECIVTSSGVHHYTPRQLQPPTPAPAGVKGRPAPPPGPVPAVHTAVSAALASYWWRRHVSDEPAADWLRGLSEKAAAGWRWLGAGCVLEPRLCTLLPRPSTVADPSSSLCRVYRGTVDLTAGSLSYLIGQSSLFRYLLP